jgi:hypothetical protein
VRRSRLAEGRRLASSKKKTMSKDLQNLTTFVLLLLCMLFGGLYFVEANKPPVTVTVSEPPVVLERAVSVPVVDTDLVEALQRTRTRAKHYERKLWDAIQSVAQADSMLRADSLSCVGTTIRMERLLARQKESIEVAQILIDALNEELAPKEDTGSVRTQRYQLDYRIAYSGRIPPGGFRYRMQLFEVPYVAPGPQAGTRHHSASVLLGVQRGSPVYGLQYGFGGERVQGVFQATYPLGVMSGIGLRW